MYTYLDIKLDSTLSFCDKQTTSSVNFVKVQFVGRIRYIVDKDASIIFYKTLILLIFDYLHYIYFRLNSADSYILQKLQNCASHNIIQVDNLDTQHT